MNRAVFLDRDGTLIEEKEYLHRPEQVVIFPGVGSALKRLQAAGFKLFVITNQSGVGRGYFPLEDVHRVHEHLSRELAKDDVRIEKFYIAPEHPDAPSRGRKPSPQFLFDARDEFGIDLTQSYMIGDKLIDLECGWNAGVKASILVRSGYGAGVESASRIAEAVVVGGLPAASRFILQRTSLCGGRVVSTRIPGWDVTWEGEERYRYWCLMEETGNYETPVVLVIMLNPGSLAGDGSRLAADTTLRILRKTFLGTGFRVLVLNLFQSAGQPKDLFQNWARRDQMNSAELHRRVVPAFDPCGVIFGYGSAWKKRAESATEIDARIVEARSQLEGLPIIMESSEHPIRWQVERRVDQIRSLLARACLHPSKSER